MPLRSALALILLNAAAFAPGAEVWPTPPAIDSSRLAAAGLRRVEGPHLDLVTDLPATPAIDELPRVVAAAVPQWAARFHLSKETADSWRLRLYLVSDREKLRPLGLLPERAAGFVNGLCLGYEAWVEEQPTNYYRRHLVLHEATHSFMATRLGGCGPGWYMEGMAELLGTHAWDPTTGGLTLATLPASAEAAPHWGRIGPLQQAFATHQALALPAVLQIDNRRALSVDRYAWVWALAKLLDTHPRTQQRFRALAGDTNTEGFNLRFRKAFREDWDDLTLEWRLMIARIEYGYDIERESIDFRTGAPLRRAVTVEVSAERGWQSTGVWVEAGKPIQIAAEGRYTIGAEPDGTPWPCEPGGVTLEYFGGRPLGQLLAAVDPRGPERPAGLAPAEDLRPDLAGGLLDPTPIGRRREYVPPRSGTLYLRVNDSPAKLRENRGTLRATLRPR